MKVVTAAAALDTGRFDPGSQVDGRNNKPISGVPLQNSGGESFGVIDLTTALTNSVNTVWAEVGEKLGGRTMQRYSERFGFYAEPPVDYPDEQMTASGVRKDGRLVPMTSRRVDVGRVAIGQGDLFATPLQMAEVAATVANGGVRMKLHLMDKAVDPDGRTVETVEPERAGARRLARNGRRADRDDEAGRARGYWHRGGARGRRGRGQDGHGRAQRVRAQPAVVHRVHVRRGRGGHARALPGRHGRDRRRADRQADPRGAGSSSAGDRARHGGRRPLPDRRPDRLGRHGRRVARARTPSSGARSR